MNEQTRAAIPKFIHAFCIYFAIMSQYSIPPLYIKIVKSLNL